MKSEDLMRWRQEWQDVTHIAVWGYGKNFQLHLNELKENYKIDTVIDKDPLKAGSWAEETIPIIFPDVNALKKKKIVITTHYEEIRSQLLDIGMQEYIDFCDIRLLVCAGGWYRHHKIILSEVHIAVTTGCTLNCRYCNMFMPFHKDHVERIPIEKLKKQLELLFVYVDKVINLVLIGGETLLYEELDGALEYIGNYFSDKVENMEIVTNGTVYPKPGLLRVLRKEDVLVSMSNYHLNDGYNEKFNQIRSALTENKIRVSVNQNLEWKDFSFPYKKLHLPDDLAYKNMDLCNPVFRGFNDSKLYFCHLVWSADRAGLHEEQSTDYIDFTEITREECEKIMKFNVCCHEKEYVSLCRECRGCSSMNQKVIPVGVQA